MRQCGSLISGGLWLGLALAAAVAPVWAQESRRDPDLARWLEVQSAMVGGRYRHIQNSQGRPDANQAQHKQSFRGRFKFDAQARLTLNGLVSTGQNITGSWNDTGWGTGDRSNQLHLTQLYLAAKPQSWIELQYGGIAGARGRSTEITTYDNDNYMMGGRLILSRPQDLFFDEVSLTVAYLGDNRTPNINKRFHRLTQSNYHQFLVVKTVSSRVTVSADYNFHNGREGLRQAVAVKAPEVRFLDSLVFENYQRLDVHRDYGFAVHGQKSLHPRLQLTAGYADIDPLFGGLNGDRFDKGKRLFSVVSVGLPANFSFEGFIQRSVATDYPISNRFRVDLILFYNLLPGLKRTGWF